MSEYDVGVISVWNSFDVLKIGEVYDCVVGVCCNGVGVSVVVYLIVFCWYIDIVDCIIIIVCVDDVGV